MSRLAPAVRAASLAAALVLLPVSITGCVTAGAASGDAGDESGWAMLDAPSDAEHIRLEIAGGSSLEGDVLIFDGATGFGAAAAPADFDPTRSFTVAAWVSTRTDAAPFGDAVSHLGDTAAGFFLGTADGLPAFSMKDADTNEPGHTTRAMASEAFAPDEWVHLAGVFDAEKGQISLYVDGEPAGDALFSAPIHPDGPLTVGRSQSSGSPSGFWTGAITEVHIIPAAESEGGIAALMDKTKPADTPPAAAAVDPSTYAEGQLNGTWDYVLEPDEIAFIQAGLRPSELEALRDLSALRLGFSGPEWWAGFVTGDTVWLVDGVPEGDGGVFRTEGSTLVTDNGSAVVTLAWALDGEELSLVLTDCQENGTTCADIDVVRFMYERVWTFRSPDPSF